MIDKAYFRYLMEKRGTDSEELGRLLGVSHSQMNYKILKGRFTLEEIFKIMEIFDMKFEEIFKTEEKKKG